MQHSTAPEQCYVTPLAEGALQPSERFTYADILHMRSQGPLYQQSSCLPSLSLTTDQVQLHRLTRCPLPLCRGYRSASLRRQSGA